MTLSSMADWLRRPEYAYLLAFLGEAEQSAREAVLSADPNDPASIAKSQQEARVLSYFTTGQVADAIKQELETLWQTEQTSQSKN